MLLAVYYDKVGFLLLNPLVKACCTKDCINFLYTGVLRNFRCWTKVIYLLVCWGHYYEVHQPLVFGAIEYLQLSSLFAKSNWRFEEVINFSLREAHYFSYYFRLSWSERDYMVMQALVAYCLL